MRKEFWGGSPAGQGIGGRTHQGFYGSEKHSSWSGGFYVEVDLGGAHQRRCHEEGISSMEFGEFLMSHGDSQAELRQLQGAADAEKKGVPKKSYTKDMVWVIDKRE